MKTLEVYPTDYCQLSCLGCNLHFNSSSLSEKDIDKIDKSKILSKVTDEISILGGEPTQWKYLNDFLRLSRISNNNVSISVTTNGIDISQAFLSTCLIYNISVNISWHDDMNILENILKLKKNKILKKIILIPFNKNINSFNELYNQLSLFASTVCRPFIGNKSYILNQPLLNLKNELHIESSLRFIDNKLSDNIRIISEASKNKNFYKSYECKCGDNGVIYTDGNLYYCLSHAMSKINPRSYNDTNETWIKCKYENCCCDTFELRKI